MVIVTTLAAFGTIVAAIAVSTQTTIIQEEFESNTRPWLAGDDITVLEGKVKYDIQNFGNIPNQLGETKFYVIAVDEDNGFISKENLPYDKFRSMPLTVVMPSQKNTITLTGGIMNAIEDVKTTKKFLYLVIVLDYPYGNEKRGEYGYLGKYVPQTNDFSMINSWAN